MKSPSYLLLFSLLLLMSTNSEAKSNTDELKPRIVIMSDIGDCNVEPDDMESAIRLFSYADQFEIEAFMTTVGWNCDPYPQEWGKVLEQVIDAYGVDVENLRKRSSQTAFLSLDEENGKQKMGYWPSVDYIRSRAIAGSHRGGIGVIGEGNDSPGSNFLIQLADEDDDRPIWVAAWGGANTLAQAIWRVQQTRTEKELKTFLHKFRLYTITDQDMKYDMRLNLAYSSHQWMRREFKDDLTFIWDEGTWQLQCELGKQYWTQHQQNIQRHGAMGSIYPNYKWGVEGDTPSFLHLMPNGLNDPDDPTQAGWGGCHTWGLSADSLTYAWVSWQQPQRRITEEYKQRFYSDELNDFSARMQWAKEGQGNTNPIVYINGTHSIKPRCIKAKAGKTITLDASMSKDDEGDHLSFYWWYQPEAGTSPTKLVITDNTASRLKFRVPLIAKGGKIHLICEVHDDGPFHLVSYQRVILEVR